MRYRDRIAYLGALSLFFSAIELFIPRIIPFFRIGLANIPILAALSLPFQDFFILLIIKAIGTSYVSGTLFSPFFIMSVSQAVLSGMAMYGCAKLFRRVSVFSISALGALVSDIVQIAVAAIYAGRGALSILPLMLLLSLPASIITAYISRHISIPENVRMATDDAAKENSNLFAILLLIISAASISLTRGMIPALISAILCLIFQRTAGRRILILPHILMLTFMCISSILTPSGSVLFRIFSFPITSGALSEAIRKSLLLSSAIALSQGFSRIITPESGLPGETLMIFNALLGSFHNQRGTLKERVYSTLMSEVHENHANMHSNIPLFTSIAISCVLFFVMIISYLFF